MIINILFILMGFILLIIGADVLVKGSINIAKRFNIPDVIIGLTIVAIGTSLPEIIITISSAIKGYTDLIIGNVIGSNLCNLLLILGFISIIRPVTIETDTKKVHIPIAILSSVLIYIVCNISFKGEYIIDGIEGIIILLLGITYFMYPIYITIKDIITTNKTNKQHTKWKIFLSIFYIILGIILLKIGADFVVDNVEKIANNFNISEGIIGLTIIAIGTALPELITSIIALIKKDTDLAIGNLIGSCVLNLLLILGVGAVIAPLTYSTEFNISLILLIAVTSLVCIYSFTGKKKSVITRLEGISLLVIYTIYMMQLFV